MILDEFGHDGQERLAAKKVLVIGSGGLGSPALFYLTAAGVGHIGIADSDVVDLSNLNRQILHATPDLNRSKADSARETLQALNPDVTFTLIKAFVSAGNIMKLIADYDCVIDATDNFASKFLINDACVLSKKPFVHAGILRFQGQLLTVVPPQSPCYRCVFPEPPEEGTVPSCSEVGVLGAVPGVLGSIQASECLKYLLNIGTLMAGRLLVYDALHATFDTIKVKKNPKCPVCSPTPRITILGDPD